MSTPTTALPPAATPTPIPVFGALPGTMVEVLPGRKYLPLPSTAVDTIALAELVPAGDGTWRAVIRVAPRWWSCSAKDLRRLGISISGASILRLIRAGFVRGQRVTPQVHQFDYHSYLEHEARTADPEFWEQTEPGHFKTNRQRFSEVL